MSQACLQTWVASTNSLLGSLQTELPQMELSVPQNLLFLPVPPLHELLPSNHITPFPYQ